jgi:hypothetical protein
MNKWMNPSFALHLLAIFALQKDTSKRCLRIPSQDAQFWKTVQHRMDFGSEQKTSSTQH